MSRVYFSYLSRMEASFCFWDTESDAFYTHTIGSDKEVPGTPYIIKNCEIDIDA